MKKALLFLILISGFCLGQEIRFEDVVKVDSTTTAKQLYSRALVWVNETYNSGKSVIQMDDKDSGILIGKPTMKYNPTFFVGSDGARGYVNYTIKISVKDGKYKYEFYDFAHENLTYQGMFSVGILNKGEKYTGQSSNGSKSFRNKVNEDAGKLIDQNIPSLIASLKLAMSSKSKKDENW